uniref:AN1-type domain-containing protein n=1 Tax=Oncorhynchus tshawytscha TaxID=74940 RepID=A0AAZ3QGN2_ONCTS
MEFPDLGEHCSENSCKHLDFLPLRCDACEEIFYVEMNVCCSTLLVVCMLSIDPNRDIQVPVCPLCNTPIPIKRGEMPDIKVGEHIDRDCQSDPAQNKRKIFTNKCSKGGCKQKEMIRVTCDQCHINYCLKHRHPLDHDCKPEDKPVSKSGFAAFMRSQGASSSSASTTGSRGSSRPVSNGNARTQSSRSAQAIYSPAPAMQPPPAQNVVPASASFQAGLVCLTLLHHLIETTVNSLL